MQKTDISNYIFAAFVSKILANAGSASYSAVEERGRDFGPEPVPSHTVVVSEARARLAWVHKARFDVGFCEVLHFSREHKLHMRLRPTNLTNG